MTGLIKTGLGVFTGGTSLWVPYLIIGCVAAAGGGLAAYKWEHAFVVAAEGKLGGKQAELDTANANIVTAKADTDRWKAASDQRDGVIAAQVRDISRLAADAARRCGGAWVRSA